MQMKNPDSAFQVMTQTILNSNNPNGLTSMLWCIFLSVPEISGAEISSYTKQVFQAFHDTV